MCNAWNMLSSQGYSIPNHRRGLTDGSREIRGQRDSFFNLTAPHHDEPPMLCLKENKNLSSYEELRRKHFISEECRYDDVTYESAATIYEAMKNESPAATAADEPNVSFHSENHKRLTFQLVFQSLKYESFLLGMLEKSQFFEKFPELIEQKPLVLVVVCDYMERKFQKRSITFGTIDDVGKIETCVLKHKTKLNASLARYRISSNFLTLDSFLPEIVRENDKMASQMFLGLWGNQSKINMEDLKNVLNENGFTEVKREDDLKGKTFMIDRHCHDFFFFPHDLLSYMDEVHFTKKKFLVAQDKSGCVAQHCMRHLSGEADDILFVNVGAGISVGHLASLLRGNGSTIYGLGISTSNQLKQCQRNFETLGVEPGQVKLVSGPVTDLDVNSEPYKNIKLVVMMAHCTRNGIVDPASFIVSEGEDSEILNNLASGMVGGLRVTNSKEFNLNLLKHFLRLPRLQTLVYCTRSLNEAEDEEVVREATDHFNSTHPTRVPYSVAPPGLPLHEDDVSNDDGPLQEKFLKFRPSKSCSGCFVACIRREAEDPQMAVKEILAKAAAKGIPVDTCVRVLHHHQ